MDDVTHQPEDAAPLAGATALVRALTGMEIAYVSRFERGEQVHVLADGPVEGTGVRSGLRVPLEQTVCQRMVDGRLPRAIQDAQAVPEAHRLMTAGGVRAYVGVPLRSPEGALLGTLCGLSRTARPELDEEQVAALEALAPLVASHLVLAGVEEREARRAAARVDALRRDLRAPAMAIRFLAEDLAAGTVAPADAGEAIEGEAAALLRALDRTLPAAPPVAALETRNDVDLVVLCAATVTRLSPAAGRVRLDLPAGPLPAPVDAHLVGHAIGTLVDGALQRSHRAPVVVELRADGPTALVLVHDDALAPAAPVEPGDARMDAAVEAGIRGLGYGLAAVRAVATAHEGTLSLEPRAGGGSTAALRLPRAGGRDVAAAA